jgi:alpha-L-fucosidase
MLAIGILGVMLCQSWEVGAAAEPPKPYGPVPAERQLKWHELEVIGMVNFSTITYYGKEWGYGDEDPSKFNPTEFDARQIVRAAKAGGLKGLVIDAKHHGGFCLWPSKFNDDYSVKNCPWKNGKGDILGELVKACREEGLAVGIYLSPWDRHHKDYGRPEYVTYFREQMTELLTNYGPVFEVWLDGANGGDGWYGGARQRRNIDRKTYYDWPSIYALIRKLQPDANIFSEIGSELRWNGNEAGVSGNPCWATFTPKYRSTGKELQINPKTGFFYEIPNGEGNYGEANQGHRDGRFWMPAEADFPQRGGWFWHPGDHSKSPADLLNRYFTSVGRNSAMDIGIAPDRRGLICEEDAAALKGFGDRIRAIFAVNLAAGAAVTASNIRGNDSAYAAANVLGGKSKFTNYWATDDGVKDAELTMNFGKPAEFSVVSLREPIQLGQRIDNWALDSWQDGQWQEFAAGVGIGARRLWRGRPITSDKVRLRIGNAAASPAISEFGVYLDPEWSRRETSLPARIETGLDKAGWTIVSASCEGAPAVNAIDNNPATLWHTHTAAGRQPPPQSLAIDMGKQQELTGFLYLPRQDGCPVGNVTKYVFAVSRDGQAWTEVAQGEFGNVAANPVQQKIRFEKPVKARYFRFTATAALDDCVSAAELGVLGK